MKSKEFIARMSRETGLSQQNVKMFMGKMRDVLREELAQSGETALPGLVKFRLFKRLAREMKLPGRSSPVQVPTKQVLKAKPLAPKRWV